jgi:hypothetical protein
LQISIVINWQSKKTSYRQLQRYQKGRQPTTVGAGDIDGE